MIAISVAEQSQVAEARRAAVELSQRAGFGETAAGRVAIVATEMATNLVKHGRGGQFLADLSEWRETIDSPPSAMPELELIAIDKGPGIPNITSALEDGYSTAGSAGRGLGAIRRQAVSFNLYSSPGNGTALVARLGSGGDPLRRNGAALPLAGGRIGAVSVAKFGENVCGDGWGVLPDPAVHVGSRILMLVDGLGHGPQAAEASAEAARVFNKHGSKSPVEIMHAMHAGLRSTRGAAVSIARFEPERRIVTFCGIGNVGGVLMSDASVSARRMITLNGTVGHVLRKVQQYEYPYPDAGAPIVILHSDGISSSWSLDKYPGLIAASPSLIAAVLFRDHARVRDDATVLVAHDLGGNI